MKKWICQKKHKEINRGKVRAYCEYVGCPHLRRIHDQTRRVRFMRQFVERRPTRHYSQRNNP